MRNLDRIRLNYEKIKVSETKKAKHEIQLMRLKEMAPYGARIHAEFSPNLGKIRGQLKVISKRHKFTALTLAQDLDSSFKAVVDDMNLQILEWKRRRFSGDTGPTEAALAC